MIFDLWYKEGCYNNIMSISVIFYFELTPLLCINNFIPLLFINQSLIKNVCVHMNDNWKTPLYIELKQRDIYEIYIALL